MKREQGVSLIVTMLMLVALAVLALSAARIAIQEDKSARAERDRQIAMQAAQSALLDAELDIEASSRSALFAPGQTEGFAASCEGAQPVVYLGLYRQADGESRPVWQAADFTSDKADSCSVRYGRFTDRSFQTGAGPLPEYAPRYIIELMTYDGGGEANGSGSYYRITAIGFGTKAATQVVLQTLYRKGGSESMMPAGRLSWREIPNWKELRDALTQK